MNGQPKPTLDMCWARERIAEVNARDRRKARLAIKDGVQAAEAQWIAAPLVTEALTLELMTIVQRNRTGAETTAYLRALAAAIE